MATLSQYQFIPCRVDGSMIGASAVQPTGTDGYLFYEIVKDTGTANPAAETNISANLNSYQGGNGGGKKVGIIAYDYVQARWSCLWTQSGQLLVKNGWLDDAGAIKDFMATLTTPVTTAQNGDALPPPASFAPQGA
jgi:hypothetical protein